MENRHRTEAGFFIGGRLVTTRHAQAGILHDNSSHTLHGKALALCRTMTRSQEGVPKDDAPETLAYRNGCAIGVDGWGLLFCVAVDDAGKAQGRRPGAKYCQHGKPY
jgi:hypothetical protein